MAATAPRKRTPAEPEASTRERMLEVALQAFSELGYDGASTRVIAARAGVNQGLIPYHFGSKEALWREAVERAFVELRSGMAAGLEQDDSRDARQRVEDLIRRFVRFAARRPEFVRMMNEEGKRDTPRMRWLVDHFVKPMYEAMVELIERAGEPRDFPPGLHPMHLHYILVGAVTQIFHQAPECKRLTGRDPTEEAAVEAHADALIALFGAGPQGTPRRNRP